LQNPRFATDSLPIVTDLSPAALHNLL